MEILPNFCMGAPDPLVQSSKNFIQKTSLLIKYRTQILNSFDSAVLYKP